MKKRNLFVVQLYDPKPAVQFRGDYRQIGADKDKDSLTLWRHLALEDSDSDRLKQARSMLTRYGVANVDEQEAANISVMAQYFDVNNKSISGQELNDCYNWLNKWVIDNKYSQQLADLLFPANGDVPERRKYLKSFGQLINHYNVEGLRNTNHSGTHYWLLMSSQILKAFGEENFKIWKNRLLQPSRNWAECLEKEEVDAVAMSIVTLKDSQDYQKIWWQLVEAHGKSAGHMRYAQLWYAFQK